MNKQEHYSEFVSNLMALAAGFKHEMDEDQILIYWLGLQDLELSEFKQSVIEAIRTLEWFPKVAQLRNLVRPSKALLAWETFVKHAGRKYDPRTSFDFGDRLINAVVRSKGGIREASEVSDDTFYSFYRKDFLEAYREFERGSGKNADLGPLKVCSRHDSTPYPVRFVCCEYLNSEQKQNIESKTQAKIGAS